MARTQNLEKTIKEIGKMSQRIKRNMERQLPVLNEQIDNLIRNRSKSTKQIEFLLDQLLDYGFLGIGKQEFQKLNNYYATINKKNAQFYHRYYREIQED